MRDRVIAALASAVVIPEAGVRSGALSVAQLAHGMARPVGVVPGVGHKRSERGLPHARAAGHSAARGRRR
ncbi:putative Rossmann fold nucleotide-binding protein DprA/Smf involved in DNA uptake [Pseudoglutamicibacter albus]|uniref:Rossmann fold nucleotide-binding protein DprA/Smf involved in DNA uptake n=2 Tax=Pseudoglutamicibacter albus TaxID=98671 RepID=A0ABU1YZ67_9MICC|nr:putative Rossmann fold nucleotide-binding protein DprA/Smf involved in DNA uptake [Pseudoglutamicibacter albus]